MDNKKKFKGFKNSPKNRKSSHLDIDVSGHAVIESLLFIMVMPMIWHVTSSVLYLIMEPLNVSES